MKRVTEPERKKLNDLDANTPLDQSPNPWSNNRLIARGRAGFISSKELEKTEKKNKP